jgi:hypothetical protein
MEKIGNKTTLNFINSRTIVILGFYFQNSIYLYIPKEFIFKHQDLHGSESQLELEDKIKLLNATNLMGLRFPLDSTFLG